MDLILTRVFSPSKHRCIRFAQEVGEDPVLGTTGRGGTTEVGTYVDQILSSEYSANVVDLCPVGALTNYTFDFHPVPEKTDTEKNHEHSQEQEMLDSQ